ncbi:MAG: RICIN domain-containing protein [Clostridia bacterium]|nr:RICIN domain-containing protein [Clostridia bacterium]
MKKFLAFVSFVLFVSIFVSILPLSAFADDSGNDMALDVPEGSFYDANKTSVQIENSHSFSEEIPYNNSQTFIQNVGNSSNNTIMSISGTSIANGIYAFKNIDDANSWMDIEQDMDSAGYHMQQYSFGGISPAESFTRSGLFKVTQVGATGRYVIRSMLNNLLSFGYENDGIYTKEIPPKDELVPIEDTYYIDYDKAHGGYTLRPYNSAQYISANSLQTLEANPYLILGEKNSSAVWMMEQVVGNQQWGGTLYFGSNSNDNLIVGKTSSIRVVTWSCDPEANEPYVSITSDNTRAVTEEWNSETSTIDVHPIVEGNMSVSISIKKSDNITSTRSVTLTSELPIPEGLCIIRNRKMGGSIRLDNAAAPNYADGTTIEIGPLLGNNIEFWYLMHYYDGYYLILSNETGSAISVPSNKTNTSGATIVQLGCTYSDTQLWKFDVSSSGNYVIRPRSAENYSTDWCLSINSLLMEQPVYQKAYTNNTDYSDEWLLTYLTGSINLNVIFDGGYNTRYSNAVTRISNELGVLKFIYLANFGITVNYNTPTQFISYGDECPNKPNGKCACTTNENCYNSTSKTNLKQYHHTNITNIMLRIPYPDMSESFTVAYIGYDTCKRNEHEANSHLGIAYYTIGLIGIANHKNKNQETVDEKKTLVHELGHIYGVIDHYDDVDDDDNVKTTEYLNQTVGPWYDDNCIYGLYKEFNDIKSNLTICEGCRRTIEANANNFNHN